MPPRKLRLPPRFGKARNDKRGDDARRFKNEERLAGFTSLQYPETRMGWYVNKLKPAQLCWIIDFAL